MTDLGGRCLNMVTKQMEPFVVRHQNETTFWYTGLCIDIVNILAESLNFTYTITEPADGIWGSQLPNGTWAGMTGMLHRKEVDFAMASISVTAARATVTDYTTGFFEDEIVMVTKRPGPSYDGWSFFVRPFNWLVYLMLVCSLPVVTVVLVWVNRRPLKMYNNNHVAEDTKKGPSIITSVVEAVETLFGTLIGRVAKLSFHADLLVFCYIHQTTSGNIAAVVYNGVSGSGRVLLCSWQLLSVVTVATYAGKLTSSSMVIQQRLPFNTLSELVKRTDYRWGIQRKTMVENVLSTSTNKDYQTFYQKMLQFATDDPGVFVKGDNSAALARHIARDSYVALFPHAIFKALKYDNCELIAAQERLFPDTLVIYLQKESPYTDVFSKMLTKMKETGIAEHLAQKWFPEKSGCQGDETTVMSVSLQMVQTAFIMAAAGVVLATAVFVAERLKQAARADILTSSVSL